MFAGAVWSIMKDWGPSCVQLALLIVSVYVPEGIFSEAVPLTLVVALRGCWPTSKTDTDCSGWAVAKSTT